MYGKIKQHLQEELNEIRDNGLYKEERIIVSAQGAEITLNTGGKVLNFCRLIILRSTVKVTVKSTAQI